MVMMLGLTDNQRAASIDAVSQLGTAPSICYCPSHYTTNQLSKSDFDGPCNTGTQSHPILVGGILENVTGMLKGRTRHAMGGGGYDSINEEA